MPQVHIGQIMSFTGVVLLLYTFFLYPICAKALGVKMGFRVGQFLAAPCFMITTLLHYIPEGSDMLIPLTIAAVSITKMSVALAFSSIALLLNETVNSEKRASMNGLSMSLGSLSKALGPFSGSLTIAWSINNGLSFPLDSHFVYIIISLIAVVSSCLPLRSADDANIGLEMDGRVNDDMTDIEMRKRKTSNQYTPVDMMDISRGKADISNAFVLEGSDDEEETKAGP